MNYTRETQRSPERKRGRASVFGRTALKNRFSLTDILTASPCKVAQLLMDAGYLLSEPPPPGSCKCKGAGSWKLEEQGLSCQWRCKCRKTVAVTCQEDLSCGQRFALRLLAGALWVYTSNWHLSPDQTSVLLGVDARALRALFERLNQLFTPLIDQLNDSLVVGGCGVDVELDEVAFRSVGRPGGIIWLRYLAAARRGSRSRGRRTHFH